MESQERPGDDIQEMLDEVAREPAHQNYEFEDLVENETALCEYHLANSEPDDKWFVPQTGSWHIFDAEEMRWRESRGGTELIRFFQEKNEQLRQKLEETIETLLVQGCDKDDDRVKNLERKKRFLVSLNNYRKLQSLEKLAQIKRPKSEAEFNTQKHLLAVKNGLVNLRTGELITDMATIKGALDTHQCSCEYNPSARPEKWMSFLATITDNDAEQMDYLRVKAGYYLTGETREQVLDFAHGAGQNGKGVFTTVLRQIFNDYFANMRVESLMGKRASHGENATPELAKLWGKRLAVAAEGAEGGLLNLSTIKQLTGENVISVRKLYGNPFELKPSCKILIETNHLPTIMESDYGTWRRLRVIPFPVTIPPSEVDTMLKEKLFAEAEGILAWAVSGAVEYYRSGIPRCQSVEKATVEYRNDSDIIQSALTDILVPASDKSCYVRDVYESYKGWCNARGKEFLSEKKFAMGLPVRGYVKLRKSAGIALLGYELRE